VQRYDRLIDPSNPDSLALYRRAVALDASGQTDKAMEDYSAAIKADPKSRSPSSAAACCWRCASAPTTAPSKTSTRSW
jgi:Flp pilus assembly protein TadD